MFDTYQNQQTIKINAVSGTIVKNYKDSFFLRFHLKSSMAERLLQNRPKHGHNDRPVVILQMMVCGDMEVIAEIMYKDDFEKMFRGDSDDNTGSD